MSETSPSTVRVMAPPVRPSMHHRRRRPSFELRMMLPALVVLVAITVVPFVMLIMMSFSHVALLGGVKLSAAGVANWAAVLSDPITWHAWIVTLIFFVLAVAFEMVLGTALAMVLNSMSKGQSVAFSLILLPMFLAPITVGLLGDFILDPTIGLYSWIMRGLHILGPSQGVFGTGGPAMLAVASLDTWEWAPLVCLIVFAGLTGVSPSILEAASVDGASYWRTLFTIILPMISPVLLVALLIRSMDAIRYYDIVNITTGGGPANATWVISLQLNEKLRATAPNGMTTLIGQASVIGLTMLVFTVIVANLFVRVLARRGLTQ